MCFGSACRLTISAANHRESFNLSGDLVRILITNFTEEKSDGGFEDTPCRRIAARRYAQARTNAIASTTASCARIHSGIRRAAIRASRESSPHWRRRTVHLKRDEPE